ncbi:DUF6062 family protein [Anaerosporobacter faecicola]|uniref:DUF6062 family protein n=1 Tax=Anaerosporobacter faecicola TaxID=2718714 RepID=UPI00143B5BFC|nr:DUF6062 family protein [Anaerosporobacter faecicola]
MKEQLYTIPVMDAYKEDCECPVCSMYKSLENKAIDFTMGPSYMEDDIRAVTDEVGFCNNHIKMLYKNQNRLGLALMLKTHMDKTITDLEKLSASEKVVSTSLFRKKSEAKGVPTYIQTLNHSCFVCNRIEDTYKRYLVTIFYLYKKEAEFRDLFHNSKGLCTTHYADLYQMAPEQLNGEMLQNFMKDLNQIYLENMKRVRDDLDWFIDKFDYRYANEPWKNSQDALPRTIQKTNSVDVE